MNHWRGLVRQQAHFATTIAHANQHILDDPAPIAERHIVQFERRSLQRVAIRTHRLLLGADPKTFDGVKGTTLTP